ncbi:hypothetical protein ACHAXS_000608, partial [Conticribra weissflogii]
LRCVFLFDPRGHHPPLHPHQVLPPHSHLTLPRPCLPCPEPPCLFLLGTPSCLGGLLWLLCRDDLRAHCPQCFLCLPPICIDQSVLRNLDPRQDSLVRHQEKVGHRGLHDHVGLGKVSWHGLGGEESPLDDLEDRNGGISPLIHCGDHDCLPRHRGCGDHLVAQGRQQGEEQSSEGQRHGGVDGGVVCKRTFEGDIGAVQGVICCDEFAIAVDVQDNGGVCQPGLRWWH